MLDCMRSTIEDLNGTPPKDESIWRNYRHPDIRHPIQSFLFRALHGSLHIGDFWRNIPNYDHHAFCPHCRDETENLDHILLKCPHRQANTIWELMKSAWLCSLGQWPGIHLGTILGCGSLMLPSHRDDCCPNRGKSRLLHIIISESAHLIWALCCENVIQGTVHMKESTTRRWLHKVNQLLTLDKYISKRWNKKPVTRDLVNETWLPLLLQQTPHLEQDWISNNEVLVGITLTEPPFQWEGQPTHGAPHTPHDTGSA